MDLRFARYSFRNVSWVGPYINDIPSFIKWEEIRDLSCSYCLLFANFTFQPMFQGDQYIVIHVIPITGHMIAIGPVDCYLKCFELIMDMISDHIGARDFIVDEITEGVVRTCLSQHRIINYYE